jgi:hypothetical protein
LECWDSLSVLGEGGILRIDCISPYGVSHFSGEIGNGCDDGITCSLLRLDGTDNIVVDMMQQEASTYEQVERPSWPQSKILPGSELRHICPLPSQHCPFTAPSAARSFAAFFRCLIIISKTHKMPTNPSPSSTRVTGIHRPIFGTRRVIVRGGHRPRMASRMSRLSHRGIARRRG